MHRFYGRAPHPSGDWLRVPGYLFWAYASQLDPLEARESIGRINEVAYPFGSMSKSDGRNFIQLLTRRAVGDDGPRPMRPTSMGDLARLAGGSKTKVRTA